MAVWIMYDGCFWFDFFFFSRMKIDFRESFTSFTGQTNTNKMIWLLHYTDVSNKYQQMWGCHSLRSKHFSHFFLHYVLRLLQIPSRSCRGLQQQGRLWFIIWCYQLLPNKNKLHLLFQSTFFSMWTLIFFYHLFR